MSSLYSELIRRKEYIAEEMDSGSEEAEEEKGCERRLIVWKQFKKRKKKSLIEGALGHLTGSKSFIKKVYDEYSVSFKVRVGMCEKNSFKLSSNVPLLVLFLYLVCIIEIINGFELCHPSCDCLDTYFDCQNKSFDHFPDNLQQFVQTLNLSSNRIRSISRANLRFLTDLESLSLDNNLFQEFPDIEKDELPDLRHLSLARNNISELNAHGSKFLFSRLISLDLSRNHIQVIDNYSFPKNLSVPLEVLNLGSNDIEEIRPGSLDSLQSLKILHLPRNKISYIDRKTIDSLPQLEELDLSRNRLEKLESLRFQQSKNIRILNFRRNKIANLSDASFYGMDRIEELYLDRNRIEIVDKRWLYGLKSLKVLNLSMNAISRINKDSWEYLEEIEILDLSHNKLDGIEQHSFQRLTNLKELYLRKNRIEVIQHDAFISLKALNILDLRENDLSWAVEDMKNPLKGLESLSSLYLGGNRIQSVHSSVFEDLESLINLDLSNNPLKFLSEDDLESKPNLILNLQDIDTYICDCNAIQLHNMLVGLRRKKFIFQHFNGKPASHVRHGRHNLKTYSPVENSPKCGYPLQLKNQYLKDIPISQLQCLNNQTRPVLIEQPSESIMFLMNGNGTISCAVLSYGIAKIFWKKDYNAIPQHLEPFITTVETKINGSNIFQINSTIHMTNVNWSDAGRYQCVASNQLGLVYSKKSNVTVHVFPVFLKKPSNTTVRLGSPAKLECAAEGYPQAEIAFQKDGGIDFPAALDRRFRVLPNDDSFFIMEVKMEDMGTYCCSAKNDAGQIKSCASLTVYETPAFLFPMEDETAVEGSNAILECPGRGSPSPQTNWTKDGIPLDFENNQRYQKKENDTLLFIKDVQVEDAGRFECILQNAVGTARDYSMLNVVRNTPLSKLSTLDSSAMTIIFIIIAVFCVVGTSAAWVVVIYRTRNGSSRNKPSSALPGAGGSSSNGRVTANCESPVYPLFMPMSDHDDDADVVAPLNNASHHPYGGTIANISGVKRLVNSIGNSSNSSDKDSGTGEEVPNTSTEEETAPFFSTFGPRASSNRRLNHYRSNSGDLIKSGLSGGGALPIKVPMPVVPTASNGNSSKQENNLMLNGIGLSEHISSGNHGKDLEAKIAPVEDGALSTSTAV